MTNVLQSLPDELREFFTEVMTEQDPELLDQFRNQHKPSLEQRRRVDDVFASLIIHEMDENYVPSDKGRRAEHMIEEFWFLWPSDQP